ncbi:MAG: ABC transporter permease subunit [Planctomycetota bacterium]
MILRQTLAILLDQYRELSAKKLFWITMILSLIVVAIYGSFGINERGLTFWHFQMVESDFNSDLIAPGLLYKFIFANLAVPIWLTWIATILALISTASIIPDFIAGGSIELALSKPIGRWRLLLTKFFSGLLFVTLQVGAFALASFIVIGVRGNDWEWRIFLAIPIVVVFFSYLFAFAVFFGLLTRSTLASLMLTALVWVLLFAVNVADGILVGLAESRGLERDIYSKRVELREGAAVREWRRQLGAGEIEGDAESPPEGDALDAFNPLLDDAKEGLADRTRAFETQNRWANRIILAKTILPKTSETIGLLNRNLISLDELTQFFPSNDDEDEAIEEDEIIAKRAAALGTVRIRQGEQDALRDARVQERFRNRSDLWVLGTSLGFEAALLALSGWIFSRRDF